MEGSLGTDSRPDSQHTSTSPWEPGVGRPPRQTALPRAFYPLPPLRPPHSDEPSRAPAARALMSNQKSLTAALSQSRAFFLYEDAKRRGRQPASVGVARPWGRRKPFLGGAHSGGSESRLPPLQRGRTALLGETGREEEALDLLSSSTRRPRRREKLDRVAVAQGAVSRNSRSGRCHCAKAPARARTEQPSPGRKPETPP